MSIGSEETKVCFYSMIGYKYFHSPNTITNKAVAVNMAAMVIKPIFIKRGRQSRYMSSTSILFFRTISIIRVTIDSHSDCKRSLVLQIINIKSNNSGRRAFP